MNQLPNEIINIIYNIFDKLKDKNYFIQINKNTNNLLQENFDKLQSDTQVEMMNLASQSMAVLRENLNADGFNFGANFGEVAGAGIKEHMHLHIVPRWIGDTNFMPVMGHTKVMIEGLKETRKQLAEAFIKNGN